MAEFLKDYGVLVTAVVGLIGIILGFVLGRLNTTESRGFARRASVYDMRIHEAREFVETLSIAMQHYKDWLRILDEENTVTSIEKRVDAYLPEFSKLPLMINTALRQQSGIHLLNDKSLSDLLDEFLSKISPSTIDFKYMDIMLFAKAQKRTDNVKKTLADFRNRVEKGQVIDEDELLDLEQASNVDITDLKEGIGLEKMQSDIGEAAKALIKMKIRLDQLAKEAPK